MPPTIISKKASNWVDRGEPPNPALRRVLGYFSERFEPSDEPWLEEHAVAIIGMVEADATEVHVAGYLPDSLSHWLASHLLSPEDLARFERDAKSDELDSHS